MSLRSSPWEELASEGTREVPASRHSAGLGVSRGETVEGWLLEDQGGVSASSVCPCVHE